MITIAIYNLKGGVGKTTTAVNMAYLAAEAGKNTVLWDWDPQAAASWYLGVDADKNKSIKVFDKSVPIASLEQDSSFERLTLVPADLSLRNIDVELSNQTGARRLIKKTIEPLSDNASILIVDCPPSISPSMEFILSGIDIVLVPMIPSPLSIRAAEQVVAFFANKKKAPEKIIGFFNMFDPRRKIHYETLSTAKNIPMKMLKTVVPMDAAAEAMSAKRAPLTSYARYGRAAVAYRKLWKEVMREINAAKRAKDKG